MAIIQGYTNSFKNQLLLGQHNFESHTFRIALYTSSANLGPDTTRYISTGEVSGTGYTASGVNLTTRMYDTFVDFNDVMFSGVTLPDVRGALIYNQSISTIEYPNPSVLVLDFGVTKSITNGNLTIRFPPATEQHAIIRIT